MRQLVLALMTLSLAVGSALAVLPPPTRTSGGPLENFDRRGLDAMSRPASPSARQLRALERLRQESGGDLVVHWGPQPGTLHHLFRRRGFLTEAAESGTDPIAIATSFIERHAELLGLSADAVDALHLSKRFSDPGTEALHLHFQQRVEGLRIFHGEVRIHLDRHGRVLSVGGDTAPQSVASAEVRLDARAAIAAAAAHVGADLPPSLPEPRLDARGRWQLGTLPGLGSEAWTDELWFPHDSGLVRAWRALIDPVGDTGWYQVVVDAVDGSLLSRHDMTNHAATQGLAFREDPSTGPQLMLPFVDGEVHVDPASPLGWSSSGESRGNNCDVKDDRANDNEDSEGLRTAGSGDPLTFAFPFDDDPALDLEASITNLFHLNNWLHDRLARMGFDAPAGNFQEDNFGLGGRGGDSVYVDAQDGGGTNNANFGTPPEGSRPRMQMYIWTRTTPHRDSGFDASVVTHELFHGVSNRLVGGADEAGCLGGAQGGAMGEAWSDFFPCSFWDTPVVGAYVSGNALRGIRRWAYDQHPLHYGQLCNAGGFQVHRDGEIWAATLWDLRGLFIARHGFQAGKCRIERLVLDGMKLAPCRPTYVDMRDAILLAARLSGTAGDECLLWEGFASRGLGVSAVRQGACTSTDDAAFDVPTDCMDCPVSAPVVLDVDVAQPNRVRVGFTPADGADEHVLLRSSAACPGACFEADFVEVARGGAAVAELVDEDGPGNRLSDGQSFSYRVLGLSGTSCTSYSACIEARVGGRCTLEPVPSEAGVVGVQALERPPATTCSMLVSWAPMASSCGSPSALRYNVYRSEDPGFEPGPEHLVASVPAPATEWRDDTLPWTSLTWIVRAEDLTVGGPGPHGGNEESNVVRLELAPQGPVVGATTWSDDVESGELPGYRRTGAFTPNEWSRVSDVNTRGGWAWRVPGAEGGTADSNLVLPRLSLGAAPVLRFAHVFKFEDDYDGAVVEISTDGGRTWTDLIADIVEGGYSSSDGTGRSRTVGSLISPPNGDELWTGQNASGFGNWDLVVADLSPYADTLDAQLRLRALFDPLALEPEGWYVDDLSVEDVLVFDACSSGCLELPTAVLPDVEACLAPDGSARVLLDASDSVAAAAGWASELAFVLTHDGPGRFAGRRWAEGPLAELSFPSGTGPLAEQVWLTVRGADGCSARRAAQVVLAEAVEPPGRVGQDLRIRRVGGELELTWGDVGADRYNVHVGRPGDDLSRMETLPALSTAVATRLLEAGEAAGPLLYLRVHSASDCGLSWP